VRNLAAAQYLWGIVMNEPQKPYFTEDQASSFARYIHAAIIVIGFCLPIIFACGPIKFFGTAGNILLKGQGMQVVLVLVAVFHIKFYISVAVDFILWRKGRFKEFRPYKHPLGRTTLKKIEYIPEEDKVGYGRLISFVFLPMHLVAISLGWFLMARNHCA
jgi:hypothetical protein